MVEDSRIDSNDLHQHNDAGLGIAKSEMTEHLGGQRAKRRSSDTSRSSSSDANGALSQDVGDSELPDSAVTNRLLSLDPNAQASAGRAYGTPGSRQVAQRDAASGIKKLMGIESRAP
jgi:hypothetical protein